MSIDFTAVRDGLAATETEVTEFDAAAAALEDAKTALVAAQDTVSTAQVNVTTATEATSSEKADVVAGIAQAIQQLNVILATLQE